MKIRVCNNCGKSYALECECAGTTTHIQELYTRADLDKAISDEREAIDGEIEETISRYQIDRVDKQLRDMRNGSVRGLREAQTIIRKRGKT